MKTSNTLALGCAIAGLTILMPAFLSAQTRPVTLDEAVDLALLYSPTIVQRQGDIRVAQAGRREYFGSWLPNLTGSSSLSTNSSQQFDPTTQRQVSGSSTSYSAGLNASYTLFDGFRRNASGRVTTAEIITADANLVSDEFGVILQTKQAYYQALAANELVGVTAVRIDRAESQLNISREKLDAGSAIRSDTLQSFVELANARLQLVNATTQRAIALTNLNRLTGIDGPIEVVDDPRFRRIVAIDTSELRAEARVSAPSVLQAEASLRVADANIASARAGYFPSLTASYSQNWSGRDVGALNNSWSARLSLSFPIFNGFTREAGMVRSNAAQEAAAARLSDMHRQVDMELTQLGLALESAVIRLELATATRVASTEDLRVQQERYRLGVATIVEVLASQINLDQSEVDIVQARLDYLTAKAQIEALIGREL